MSASVTELLDAWIGRQATSKALAWLRDRVTHAGRSGADASFYMGFSAVPRHLGKADLDLGESDLTAADNARPGFQPARWSVDQAARVRLVLSVPSSDPAAFTGMLDRLFDDGDLGELVALYQGLPLYPHPEAHRARAAEGIRTNMKAVFEAVALDNPYPAEQLDEDAFNQLVLKALFIGSPLYRVRGLDERVGPKLASMLSDYAHERWAAGRPVSPELWRGVGPAAEGRALDDLKKVLETGSDTERLAAALSAANNPKAAELRKRFDHVFDRVQKENVTWKDLAQRTE